MPLAACQAIPVLGVLREVNLLGRPEGRHVLLVHLPNAWVFDGEHHPPPWVVLEQGVLPLQFPVLCGDATYRRADAGSWRNCVGRGANGDASGKQSLQIGWELDIVVFHHDAVGGDNHLVRQPLDAIQCREVLILIGSRHDAPADTLRSRKLPRFARTAVHAHQEAEAPTLILTSRALELPGSSRAGLAPGREKVQDDGQVRAQRELVQGRATGAAVWLHQVQHKIRRCLPDKVAKSACIHHLARVQWSSAEEGVV
mmetsp:Transcript_68659/g.159201  ORF Transcript_68659/g.159201 Transcript_68659/m.159201 type:complete len:256 (+) Transcript_68659:1011-1778(+)